ncbi:MAG TPA: hypothetical protein PKE00_01930, partial [Planctomycetota bacterium]|nr:hypothetical protein [Planctomycetota bacterium]
MLRLGAIEVDGGCARLLLQLGVVALVARSVSGASLPLAPLFVQGAPAAAAQDSGAKLDELEDRRILSVRITGLEKLRPEVVLSELRTRAGARLRARAVRDDLAFLWSRFKLQCRVFV